MMYYEIAVCYPWKDSQVAFSLSRDGDREALAALDKFVANGGGDRADHVHLREVGEDGRFLRLLASVSFGEGVWVDGGGQRHRIASTLSFA